MPHVTVVGGGVAGLCAAYYLCRAGAAVTVLETRRVGSGASSGNAGWVTPAQAGPLPEPGLLGYGMRSLLDPGSALYFDPRELVRMVPWLLRFARRCNASDNERGRLALAQLGQRAFTLLDEMVADGVDVEPHRTPLLVAGGSAADAESFRAQLEPLAGLGFRIPESVLGAAAVRALEPALTDAVNAGFVIEQHRYVDPPALMSALHARVLALGAEVLEGVEVREIDTDGARVIALRTSAGVRRCDTIVLAAGAWLAALGRTFGVRLPVAAGKGYSFEVRPAQMPRHALLLLDPHVGCSPIGGRLRVAGTMEFSGVNGRLNRRRIRSIVDGAERMIGAWRSLDEDSVWSGLRPIAPDGLPIVDRHPRLGNVFIAGAYSMLGMTLAAPAGESLASFVLSGRRPPELEPLRCTRFGVLASVRAVR
ncbi:MAG TPA: FAD-dependent oxidoreductase [Solirubrobacteraceae bacterium]|nr:FAD-dependent oxidoreductase [Solirubrobacteraceae bacterium]